MLPRDRFDAMTGRIMGRIEGAQLMDEPDIDRDHNHDRRRDLARGLVVGLLIGELFTAAKVLLSLLKRCYNPLPRRFSSGSSQRADERFRLRHAQHEGVSQTVGI